MYLNSTTFIAGETTILLLRIQMLYLIYSLYFLDQSVKSYGRMAGMKRLQLVF